MNSAVLCAYLTEATGDNSLATSYLNVTLPLEQANIFHDSCINNLPRNAQAIVAAIKAEELFQAELCVDEKIRYHDFSNERNIKGHLGSFISDFTRIRSGAFFATQRVFDANPMAKDPDVDMYNRVSAYVFHGAAPPFSKPEIIAAYDQNRSEIIPQALRTFAMERLRDPRN